MPGDDRPTTGAARLAAASRTTRIGLAVAVLALLCAGAWLIRPLLHPIVMLGYQYPLVTWLPLLLGIAVAAGIWLVGRRAKTKTTTKSVARAGVGAAALVWAVGMIAMPSLQGHALYEQTRYFEGAALPSSTQPRLLPKNAAQRYGDFSDMRHAHLAVDPDADQLVWTAEHKPGPIPRGPSDGWAVQPLDRLDGTLTRRAGGFEPAISRVGPGSIRWRA